ncbi:MAG: flagellar hook protein FlgE [Armatimonadota bacterium]
MLTSLSAGVSGLRAQQTQLEVTGNNLANVNTTGFKSTRVSFSDILSRTLSYGSPPSGTTGGTNPKQVGSGVQVAALSVNHAQGAIQTTGRDGDVAISGTGFFVLSDNGRQVFTRDGAFTVDSEGYLVSSTSGLRVLGVPSDATSGVAAAGSGATYLRVPLGTELMARPTSSVQLAGNLSANTIESASAVTRFVLYDSLGAARDIQLAFSRQADGTWTWEAREANSDTSIGSGTISFGSNGLPSSGALGEITLPAVGNAGMGAQTISLDMSHLTQMASDTDVRLSSQDGLPPAPMTGFSFDKDGTLVGHFANGLSRPLGRLALAYVPNPAGLRAVGENLWAVAPNSGQAQITEANKLGSSLIGGALEMSNVDMAEEFTRMIIAQRAFQASARVITSSDEVLQELMQIKR